MKKEYFLVLDVETANSTDDALVYDLGYCVCDRQGTLYAQNSFVIREIFIDEIDLMQSAYYSEKLPRYFSDLDDGTRNLVSFFEARKEILQTLKKFNISKVFAYNSAFDTKALNTTMRFLTKSKYRYFFPYDISIHCIWNMACQVICTQKKYIRFCVENNKQSASGNISTSAESVYAFLTNQNDFCESHTGLEDTLIETEILATCYRKHKKMNTLINRSCWRIPQKVRVEMGL